MFGTIHIAVPTPSNVSIYPRIAKFPLPYRTMEKLKYNLKLEYVLTQTFSISIVRQGEGDLELREYVYEIFTLLIRCL
jgi:hypothetical protein